MSMVSAWTMGAMASKKASASAPVSAAMACPRAAEVSGPVAMIQLPSSGRAVISPSAMVTSGWARRAAVTSAEKASRSTASAPPAGSLWRSAAVMMRPPAARISQCSWPTALFTSSSERKLLEQTISAQSPVRWAKVPTWGRISCRITGTPARAACHAASEPAMPAPTIWMGWVMGVI